MTRSPSASGRRMFGRPLGQIIHLALLLATASTLLSGAECNHSYFSRSSFITSEETAVPTKAIGIQQCQLPANLPIPGNHGLHKNSHELVIIKIWVRAVISDGRLHAKGFVWAPSHDRRNQPVWRDGKEDDWANDFETSAPAFVGYNGSIYLRSVQNPARRYGFTINIKDHIRALHITDVELHSDDWGGEFELRMDTVNKHCQIFADTANEQQAHLLKSPEQYALEAVAKNGVVHGPKPLIFVAELMHIADEWKFALILDMYVKHHVLIGMTRLVAYIGHRMAHVTNKPEIQAHVLAGRLELLSWDGAPRTNMEEGLGNDLWGPQYAIHNHALLRFWLVDCWLAIADFDEFVMTSRPGLMIHEALSTCAGITPLRELRLARRLAFCLVCNETRPDIETIMDPAIRSQFKHPLMMFGVVWRDNTIKSIVFPSWVLMFGIHRGWFFTGGDSALQSLGQCQDTIQIVHMGNLHKIRNGLDAYARNATTVTDPGWWWPYQPHIPFFKMSRKGKAAVRTSFQKGGLDLLDGGVHRQTYEITRGI